MNHFLAFQREVGIAPSKTFGFYHKAQYLTRPGAFENTNLESLCKHGQIEARSGGQGGLQISEKRYVQFAPTVRSDRLKRYKVDFTLRLSATGEKGCASRSIGGRGESPSP